MKFNPLYPQKVQLAHLPTPILPLKPVLPNIPQKLFIKRDDQTGVEMSGNKVRKLEFSIGDALKKGCDTLITCGGIQSNHCRATAAASARLGLSCVLFLRSEERQAMDGNYLLDGLFGAHVQFITAKEYLFSRQDLMEKFVSDLSLQNKKGYIIPEGASNGVGTFGYFEALEEIHQQEIQLGLSFDTIVCTVGSGGTYAGLCLSNKIYGWNKSILGFNICNDAAHFTQEIMKISQEFSSILNSSISLLPEDIHIIDGSPGRGYALNTPEEMDFISKFSKTQGVILDPVYTGKAMKGLLRELQLSIHPLLSKSQNILFIHTGGLYGLFPKRFEFSLC